MHRRGRFATINPSPDNSKWEFQTLFYVYNIRDFAADSDDYVSWYVTSCRLVDTHRQSGGSSHVKNINKLLAGYEASHLRRLQPLSHSFSDQAPNLWKQIACTKAGVTLQANFQFHSFVNVVFPFVGLLSVWTNSIADLLWHWELLNCYSPIHPSVLIMLSYQHFIIFSYLLTYSMEQSPSWEANWFCS